jgi:hypothetical protein
MAVSGHPHLLASLLQQIELPTSWDQIQSGEEPLGVKKIEPRFLGHPTCIIVTVPTEVTRLNGFP